MAVAASCQRRKLHYLTVLAGHIRGELGGVRLIPSAGFLAKIQSDSLEPPDTFVPDLKAFFGGRGRQTLVPCTGIRWYVDRTKSIRTGHKRLFVSTVPPFRPSSRDTIACWIVTAIRLVPCTGIRWYVDRTKSIRTGHKRLFVSTVPPFRPASRDTIACCIVTAIRLVLGGGLRPLVRFMPARCGGVFLMDFL